MSASQNVQHACDSPSYTLPAAGNVRWSWWNTTVACTQAQPHGVGGAAAESPAAHLAEVQQAVLPAGGADNARAPAEGELKSLGLLTRSATLPPRCMADSQLSPPLLAATGPAGIAGTADELLFLLASPNVTRIVAAGAPAGLAGRCGALARRPCSQLPCLAAAATPPQQPTTNHPPACLPACQPPARAGHLSLATATWAAFRLPIVLQDRAVLIESNDASQKGGWRAAAEPCAVSS